MKQTQAFTLVLTVMIFSCHSTFLQAASSWNALYKETERLLAKDDSDTATIARNIQQLRSNAAKLGGISYLNRVSRLSATLDIRMLLERGDIAQAEKSLKMYGAAGTVAPIATQLQEKIEKAKQQEQQRAQARTVSTVQKTPYRSSLSQKYEPYKPAAPRPVYERPLTPLSVPISTPVTSEIVRQQEEPRTPTLPEEPEPVKPVIESPTVRSLEQILGIDDLADYVARIEELLKDADRQIAQVKMLKGSDLVAQIHALREHVNEKRLEIDGLLRKVSSLYARDRLVVKLRELRQALLVVIQKIDAIEQPREIVQEVIESGKASGAQVIAHALGSVAPPKHTEVQHQENIRESVQQVDDAWLSDKFKEIEKYLETLRGSQKIIEALGRRNQRWAALSDKRGERAQKIRSNIAKSRNVLQFALQDATKKLNDIDTILQTLSDEQRAKGYNYVLEDFKTKTNQELALIEQALQDYKLPELEVMVPSQEAPPAIVLPAPSVPTQPRPKRAGIQRQPIRTQDEEKVKNIMTLAQQAEEHALQAEQLLKAAYANAKNKQKVDQIVKEIDTIAEKAEDYADKAARIANAISDPPWSAQAKQQAGRAQKAASKATDSSNEAEDLQIDLSAPSFEEFASGFYGI